MTCVVGFGGYLAVPAYLAAAGRAPDRRPRGGRPARSGPTGWRPGQVFTAAPSLRLAHATAIGIPLRPPPAAYVPLPLCGGEQRLNAEPGVAAGGGTARRQRRPRPAWIETALIPALTDPERIASMSAHASAAGAADADVALAGMRAPWSPSDERFASSGPPGPPRRRRHPRQTSATSLLVVALNACVLVPSFANGVSSDGPTNRQALTLAPYDMLIHGP
ncbi:hypothetical protein AAH979_40625 [Plantactinospora sp. ZYX-F-223]|uniref:hypothetical protein n=1 Tax=Plantactinospora sp. ZYX-F-223 TaxID=3144103 RepID=UPI0031FBCAFC